MEKLAFITGSRRGIGLAIARGLALDGYICILSGTAPQDEALAAGFQAKGWRAEYLPCDISDLEAIDRAFAHIEARYGRLDLLVNNAGVAPKIRADVLETTPESFDHVIGTNLRGCYFMCQRGARVMLEYKHRHPEATPRIVNISSVSAYAASINRGEYCVSKAGISMVTQLFAARLAPESIPVFEVRPGIIRTDMTSAVTAAYEARIAQGLTPVPRMGEPEDVANCVRALAGGQLDFAAGQVIDADGGFSIRRL